MRNEAFLAVALLSVMSGVRAEPAVLLQQARLVPTDGAPSGGFGRAIAVHGNVAVVSANPMSDNLGAGPNSFGAAYVYERSGSGVWSQVARLTPSLVSDEDLFGQSVAVEGRTIVVGAVFGQTTYVFEDTGAGWVETAALHGSGSGHSVAIHDGVIAVSSLSPHGLVLYRRGANGWASIATYQNGFGQPDIDYLGPGVDITSNRAIHGSYGRDNPPVPAAAYIYTQGPNGDWSAPTVTAISDASGSPGVFSNRISGDVALIGGSFFEPDASGTWRQVGATRALFGSQDVDANTAVATDDSFSGLSPLAEVYRRTPAPAWPLAAELAASDGAQLTAAQISGNRVIASSFGSAAYIYDLPVNLSRPALLQDDFQDGNATGWSTTPSSNFSVVAGGPTLVYRQSNVDGNATALLQETVGPDQSIQVDVRPRSFNGADRWFGLTVRYTDLNNYYYVTVRSTNVVQLRKIVGGVFQTLASAPLPVAVDRNYRLRLEAIGSRVRLFVDNKLLLETTDASLTQGQAGLVMFKTSADYDNVVLNPNPAAALFAEDFELAVSTRKWRFSPGGSPLSWQRVAGNGSFVWRHTSTAGGVQAKATAIGTTNQIVQADARAATFGSGADRWFGISARHIDDANYHYVTVRSSNTISLRKLVNGATQVLDSAPLTVTPGAWYRLRLEIIGQSVRAYVNGALILEAIDPSIASTRTASGFGLVMYKTAAEYDNFVALQP